MGWWTSALGFVSRRGTAIGFIAAVLLALPTLNSPLLEDDTIHRLMLLDRTAGVHWGPLELYDFVGSADRPASRLRSVGVMPWFTDEDLRIRFFRPLSSAVITADARLFGPHLWASRLHSLAWFLAIVWLTSVLYRRFLPRDVAGLATLMYAVSVGHVLPVNWIAARHGLIATAFALAAFWLHVRAREESRVAGRWLAVAALAVGLLAGEIALGCIALVGSWELFVRRDPLRARAVALTPLAALTLAYLATYRALGYGVRASGAYLGLDSGVSGALVVLRHFFILIGEMIAATPSDAVGTQAVGPQMVAAIWGGAAALAAWALYRFARAGFGAQEIAAMRWMPVAAAAAAVPGTLALVGGRVLTVALVPASGVVAVLIARGTSAARQRGMSKVARQAAALAVFALAFAHLVAAPILRVVIGTALTRVAEAQHVQATLAPSCSGLMVLIAAADPTIAMYVPATAALEGRDPGKGLRVLSLAAADHRIENVTLSGFDLVSFRRTPTRSVWELLYRRRPIPSGTHVSVPPLDVTVIEDFDGAPTRVRFDFGEPLDSPDLCFVEWRDGRLRSLPPPAPGRTIEVPHQPGPLGF